VLEAEVSLKPVVSMLEAVVSLEPVVSVLDAELSLKPVVSVLEAGVSLDLVVSVFDAELSLEPVVSVHDAELSLKPVVLGVGAEVPLDPVVSTMLSIMFSVLSVLSFFAIVSDKSDVWRCPVVPVELPVDSDLSFIKYSFSMISLALEVVLSFIPVVSFDASFSSS
jgi:hypothetical protein